MDVDLYARTIEAAAKDQEKQFRDAYIGAQLDNPLYNRILLQAGPKCTLNCRHCYGSYGPHFDEVPSKEVVDRVVEEALGYGTDGITLSDGEPIMEENKYMLSELIGSGIPLSIITNSTFAYGDESLLGWTRFFMDEGLNFGDKPSNHVKGSKDHTRLKLSQSDAYPAETIEASPRILRVFHDAFGLGDVRDYVQLCFLWGGRDEIIAASKLINTLQREFRTKSYRRCNNIVYIDTGEGGIGTIEIYGGHVRPCGKGIEFLRASGIKTEKMTPESIGFTPDEGTIIHIDHKGDMAYGGSGGCIREERVKGNILTDSIPDAIEKIQEDPVYWAFQLGGARFLYHLARLDDPSFSSTGLGRCQACNDTFGDSGRIAGIRKRIGSNGQMKQRIAELFLDFGKTLA